MSSLKQIEANRRNALKSTGPTTPEGKARSRCNAVRHGLTAETVVAALEDSNDYQAFEAAVIADYAAETALERELVLRLASVLWRLRRVTGIETALFEKVTAEPGNDERDHPQLNLVGGSDLLERSQNDPETRGEPRSEPEGAIESDPNAKTEIVDCFLRLATLPTFPLDRLNRYEYILWRQARQLVLTLETLKRRKTHTARPAFPFSFRRPLT